MSWCWPGEHASHLSSHAAGVVHASAWNLPGAHLAHSRSSVYCDAAPVCQLPVCFDGAANSRSPAAHVWSVLQTRGLRLSQAVYSLSELQLAHAPTSSYSPSVHVAWSVHSRSW